MSGCFAHRYVCVLLMYLVPVGARKGLWMPRNRSCGCCEVLQEMRGIKSAPSGRVTCSLNSLGISPVPNFLPFKKNLGLSSESSWVTQATGLDAKAVGGGIKASHSLY